MTFRSHCGTARSRRRGLTLVEVGIALVLATTAAMAVVQLIGVVAQQRRLTRQRQVALLEVANQAERVALRPWDECGPEDLTAWEPSAPLAAELRGVKCRIEVTEMEQLPKARRIDLSVSWTTPAGQSTAPLRLTLWKHQNVDET